MDFFTTYSYAAGNLLLAICTGVALAFSPASQRLPALLSGMLAAPWALAGLILSPAYWRPVYVIPWVLGIEDVVFMFCIGVLTWPMAQWPFERCPPPTLSIAAFARRVLACWSGGTICFLVFLSAHCRPMWSSLASMALLLTALLLRRPYLRPLGLRGMIRCTVFYAVTLKLVFMLAPTCIDQWNRDALLGFYLLGLPLEEILWAAGFGAVWPAVLAFAMEPQPQSSASPAILNAPTH